MVIRRVRPEEKFEANLVSAFAFHTRAEDPEKYMRQAREDALKDTTEDWAAFSEDGKVMARIINNRFETFLDGQLIPNGGIGAVSTLPEYRNTGAVRAIFERLIPEAYRNGEVISTLYPFNHAFYRKFGYETVRWRNEYEFPPSVLRGYSFSGSAEMWNSGAPVSEYTKLYNRFAAGYNLAVHRTDASMLKDHLNGEWLKNRKFGYLLRENGTPVAYVIFRDIRHDPAAILSVEDLAWDGRAGMNAILGFLGRFTADYGTIRMFLPSCVDPRYEHPAAAGGHPETGGRGFCPSDGGRQADSGKQRDLAGSGIPGHGNGRPAGPGGVDSGAGPALRGERQPGRGPLPPRCYAIRQ